MKGHQGAQLPAALAQLSQCRDGATGRLHLLHLLGVASAYVLRRLQRLHPGPATQCKVAPVYMPTGAAAGHGNEVLWRAKSLSLRFGVGQYRARQRVLAAALQAGANAQVFGLGKTGQGQGWRSRCK